MHRNRLVFLLAGVLAVAASAAAQAQSLDSLTIAGFRWRAVGPANFEGRVADVVGIPSPSKTFFVAAAAGGIWKTTNRGTTFRPVFENYPTASMGALAIAPSDTMQVWAGTGEQNSRNTIEPGAGIYKSTDGGITWKLMGLEKTQHIGRIAVHPTNPNVVYVAALGAAWKSNPERGLYKTEDGGTTWKLVKFVSDKAGFIDVAIDPKNPNVVWASSYERVRGPYFLKSGGPGSGLWKSTDAGTTWTEIKGTGWPTTEKGRISFSIFPQNPDIVYVMVEADSIRGQKAAPGTKPARQKLGNGLYRTQDGGKTWEKMNDANTRPFYYSQVRVHPRNSNRVWFSSTSVLVSDDGGKTARSATQGIHVDHHAMWIDPNDPDFFVVGDDGGISITWDGGGNYDFGAHLPIGQFYDVSYDFEVPYNICGGAQDNGSWCGPSRRKNGPVTNAYWFTIAGGDGFYTAQHPQEPHIVWGESQGGNVSRLNLKTGERTSLVKPTWRPRYAMYEDSILIARGDTTRPATRETEKKVADIKTRQKSDSSETDMRFNWESPYFLSAHNPDVFYMGGNRVLKSTARGDNLYPISPDLSKKNWAKIDTSMNKTGGITLDATGAETYGTVVSLAESYMRPGYLQAGTDDGNVWVTKSDGASWEQIPMTRFAGIPTGDVYVSRIEPSHFDSLTFYITFDNHRWNDFTPYLYVTNDYGKTFRSLAGALPKETTSDFVHVVREDPYNKDLLFVGTSRAVYFSLNRGQNWQRFMSGMPTVPVYDLKIHPRDRELIAATHGRSFWIVDIAQLEQMTGDKAAKIVADNAYLFEPKTAREYGQGPAIGASSNGEGHKVFNAPSPTYGAEIVYRIGGTGPMTALAGGPADDQGGQPATGRGGRGGRGGGGPQAQIVITDARGDTVRTLTGPAGPGLHRVSWDFRGRALPRPALGPAQLRDSILTARRADFVFDSLEKAGTMPKATIDRIRAAMAGDLNALFGRGGGGGGRGGRGGDAWNPRPGEGGVVGAGGRGGGGGRGGEGAQTAEANPLDALNAFPGGMQELQDLLRVPGQPGGRGGRGGGGFGRGGGQAPVVNTGDYLVTLTVGGRTYRQVLRVERVSGGDDTGFGFDDEERDPKASAKKK
jgi:photosystem II stability/assembly factor-like uncharacterized protein